LQALQAPIKLLDLLRLHSISLCSSFSTGFLFSLPEV
jgi:hypothetical protein